MSAPTQEEIEALKEFRKNIADLGIDSQSDLYFLRWLRARELNLKAAEEMLRTHMKWRAEEDLDNVLEWKTPENISKDYSYDICGRDAQGHPICLIPFGVWDVRKVLVTGQRHDWLRNIDQMFARLYEKMKELSPEFKTEITQCILIVDFADFSLKQLTSFANVSTILEAVRRFESNYPEVLYRMYFVNAFRVFQMLFNLMRPLLSARTLSKLEIYTSPSKWLPVFKSRIPSDQLPAEFGGTKNLGRRRSSVGNALTISDVDVDLETVQMTTAEIAAGNSLKLEYDITEAKTVIKWIFNTESYDIGFSVHCDGNEIVTYRKCDSHINQEIGFCVCDQLGKYVLIFDNTYSKLRGKRLMYNVELEHIEIANGTLEA